MRKHTKNCCKALESNEDEEVENSIRDVAMDISPKRNEIQTSKLHDVNEMTSEEMTKYFNEHKGDVRNLA